MRTTGRTTEKTSSSRSGKLTAALFILCGSTPLASHAQTALNATKDLTISAETNDLSAIASVTVSAKGVIAIVQPQDFCIRFFDQAGRSLGVFGRKGGGPGEFQQFSVLGWKGDSLWMFDPALNRVTLISPTLKLVRTSPLPLTLKSPNGGAESQVTFGTLRPSMMLLDGSLLGSLSAPAGSSVPRWLPSAYRPENGASVVTSLDGTLRRVVLLSSATSTQCELKTSEDDGSQSSVLIPFCFESKQVYGTEGRILLVRAGISEGERRTFQAIALNALSGDTLFKKSYDYKLVAVPSKLTDSIRQAKAAAPNVKPRLKKAYQTLQLPKYFPPIAGGPVLFGIDGTIWLRDGNASSNRPTWRVLDGKGKMIGMISFPANVRIQAISRDHAWGTETNADGAKSVVRFVIR